MKKIFIFCCVLILAISLIADSFHEIYKDNFYVNELLQCVKKIENTAKSRDLVPVEVLIQEWEDEQWVNDQLMIQNYDSNGFIDEILYHEWDNEQWIVYARAISTNNEFGWPLETYMQMWDSQNEMWVDMAHYTTNYDEDGSPLYSLIQVNFSGVWTNMMQMTYSWSGELLMEIFTEEWDFAFNVWTNMERNTYTYDGEDLIEVLDEQWENEAWLNDENHFYYYDDNHHILEELKKIWWDGSWLNERYEYHSYDGNWHEVEHLIEIWNNGSWVDFEITYQTWNGDLLVEKLVQQWQNTREWVNQSWEVTTYAELDAPEDVLQQNLSLSNYPNPFNPNTNISFSIENNNLLTKLEIFNAKGQLVKTLVNAPLSAGNYLVEWNGKNDKQKPVVSGFYFCRLTSGKSQRIQKMILMK